MQGNTWPSSNRLDLYKYIEHETKNKKGARQSKVIPPVFMRIIEHTSPDLFMVCTCSCIYFQ
jgi:hypothetical protein